MKNLRPFYFGHFSMPHACSSTGKAGIKLKTPQYTVLF